MPVGRSSARPCVSISASRAVAIPRTPGPCLIRMIRSDPPEAPPVAAPRSLSPTSATLPLEATREGSIRIPSSFCGAVGHKPTYGLVPYTGVFPIELTLDHTGPIARTAGDAARLLEVLAGADGLDPRQPAGLRTEAYTKPPTGHARGLRVGIVTEGFGWPNSEPDVDAMVRDAAQRLPRAGATLSEV